uniref:DUF6542 domain-containing protein n=1 Tax=Streptomyces murinus TaxID=33900 RepID=UPI00313450D4
MEQHRTRPPNDGRRRGHPPHAHLPPQARRRPPGPEAGRGAGQSRPARPVPGPRLTGLGGGLFCIAAMFLLGCLDQLLFDGSLPVYGVLFLPVCVLTALWVRPGDVLTAPVAKAMGTATGAVST